MTTRMLALLALTIAADAAHAAGNGAVAVLEFRDDTGTIAARGGSARALRSRVTIELKSHGFDALGLDQLASTLKPDQLMAKPPLDDAAAAAIGRASGAAYLVTGTIGAYEGNVGTSYRKSLLATGGRTERVADDARLAVDLEVRDARDGHVLYTRHVEGNAEAQRTELSRDPGDLDAQSRGGPAARAIGAAAIEIGDFVACELRRRDECLAEYTGKDQPD